jgi:RNA polymerase sigma factor (sigma-70 family)
MSDPTTIEAAPTLTKEERQALVMEHLGVAGELAKRFTRHRPRDFPAAFDDAVVALCRAALLYRPGRYRFTTFAWKVIKNALLHRAKAAGRACRGGDRAAMAVDPAELAWVAATADDEPEPEARERGEAVRAAVRRLSPRHRAIVEARAWRGETLAAVSLGLGVTKERVRQLEAEAHRRLRAELRGRV